MRHSHLPWLKVDYSLRVFLSKHTSVDLMLECNGPEDDVLRLAELFYYRSQEILKLFSASEGVVDKETTI